MAELKPFPHGYLKCAAQLGVDPAACLVFDDSVTGVTAGVRSGAKVIAVCNPFSKMEMSKQTVLPEKYVVYDVDDLDEVIKLRC